MFKNQFIQIALLFFSLTVFAETDNAIGYSMSFWHGHHDGEVTQHIRLLGAVRIRSQHQDQQIAGLSGLAWDEDEQLLYAISDFGKLLHLKPVFQNNILHSVELMQITPLLDQNGSALNTINTKDSEGLVVKQANNSVKGDTELIISFEREPRVWRYNTQGEYLGSINIPDDLKDINNYKAANSALESLAFNSKDELTLIPEHQLKNNTDNNISVFHKNTKFSEIPLSNSEISGITAIEYLDDNNLLILERSYRMRVFPRLEIRLKKWNLQEKSLTTLFAFKNDGEFAVDNFEGLTRYQGNKFFIISDDNANSYQQTILLLFEIIE